MSSALESTKLIDRAINLVVASVADPTVNVTASWNEADVKTGRDLSGLDIEFIVEKSLKASEPNTAQIRVYNLSPASRQALSGAKALNVRLEAGYVGGISQLYFAQCRAAWSTRENSNYNTHIESTDTIARPTGLRKTKKIQPGSATGSLYRTMGAKVDLKTAFRAITQSLGISEGNLEQALSAGAFPISSVNGSALLGNGARRMTDLCRSAGLEWSIQDGCLQLLNIGEALSTTRAISLDDNTGLIESPSVDSQGALTFTTLLIPGIAPGVLVNMNSEFVQGGYRIEKVRYAGNTAGNEWYAHCDAVKY